MRFYYIFISLIFMFALIAADNTSNAEYTLTDNNDYSSEAPPSHIAEAAKFYGETGEISESERILETATLLSDNSKKFRNTKQFDAQRDIASQNKIDSNWTEELTELHKMDED